MKKNVQLFAALLGLALAAPATAEKTDTVVLENGNGITGEVKSLDFGVLRYSTDSMGTVRIDWEDVVAVTSKQTMQVEITTGARFFGTLESADDRFSIAVRTPTQTVNLPTEVVVRMTPIDTEGGIVARLEGSISAGFSGQKSSRVSTFNLATDIRYRQQAFLLGLNASAFITDQPSNPTTHRATVAANYERFRLNRWFTDWFINWERNDELGVLSRYSGGGAFGRYLVQNNRHQLSLTAGLLATREQFTGQDPGESKGEGRIQGRYLFRNLEPESSVSWVLSVYPLLEDPSQYRAESDLSLRRELIEDLFFDISLYGSYVSDPPTGAANSDYGVTTSLGYSF